MLIDTHAHIHFEDYRDKLDDMLSNAYENDVQKIITVGVDDTDSARAVGVARAYENIWASVGLHPHEAERGYEALEEIARLSEFEKVVAIGEYGLDYSREGYDVEAQERAFRFQIELALEHDLASIFHVRDAFDDFYRILDEYDVANRDFRGVVHCFTGNTQQMQEAVDRGLYIALNGIMTFTKDETQLDAAVEIPLDNLVLETDSPFLTPVPKRGQPNEPANVLLVAEFLAELREETLDEVKEATTDNAQALFGI